MAIFDSDNDHKPSDFKGLWSDFFCKRFTAVVVVCKCLLPDVNGNWPILSTRHAAYFNEVS